MNQRGIALPTRSLLAASAILLALGGCNKPAATADAAGNATAAAPDTGTPAHSTVSATGSAASNGAYGPGLVTTPVFAQGMGVSDMYEIASSKLALQQSKVPAIRDYARMMIAEHTVTTDKLKLAIDKGHADVTPPTALDERHATMMAQLQKAAPDKFDAEYLDQQTQSHREALGLLESYSTHGDNPSFRVFAAETKPKVQKHLDMVAKLDHGGADDKGAEAAGSE